ncbi:MAG: hypothetical protein AVDCRST_MAG49-455, partial [uncultured Thermomicrobiales bacterium]
VSGRPAAGAASRPDAVLNRVDGHAAGPRPPTAGRRAADLAAPGVALLVPVGADLEHAARPGARGGDGARRGPGVRARWGRRQPPGPRRDRSHRGGGARDSHRAGADRPGADRGQPGRRGGPDGGPHGERGADGRPVRRGDGCRGRRRRASAAAGRCGRPRGGDPAELPGS